MNDEEKEVLFWIPAASYVFSTLVQKKTSFKFRRDLSLASSIVAKAAGHFTPKTPNAQRLPHPHVEDVGKLISIDRKIKIDIIMSKS